jgi:hypothetical protein
VTSGPDLPPHLQARYGVRGRSPLLWAVIGLVAVVFAGAVGLAGYGIARPRVDSSLLAWNDVAPDRVDVTFDVRRGEAEDVWCVIRAQDEGRADVGYAVVPVPRGSTYRQVTYPLRTLAPAFVVELLGCEAGQPPDRVPPPQFPPGVAAPEQPWTP